MKLSNNSKVGQPTVLSGGVHGGGWTTSIRIADDGWSVCRNDTETGGIRGPSDTRWTQLHRWSENVPYADFKFRGLPAWIYDVDVCKSDSTRIVMSSKGRVYKSSDRGATFTKLSAFKSGNPDTTLTFMPEGDARLGGNQVRIDPVNKDHFAIGHPVDGGYVTTNGGTSIAIPASLPAPINGTNQRRGVHWAFDRSTSNGTACQTVYCMIAGRGVYRSTTGLGGTWTLLSGGPLYASSMEAAGGKLFVCGEGIATDTQLFVWSGSAWTQPSGVTGMALAVDPASANNIICQRIGGGQFYSSNAGANWTLYSFDNNKAGGNGECPWLNVTGLFFVATGAIAWERRTGVNRLVLACGIGIFDLDNPPMTVDTQKYVDRSMGIKQLLLKNAIISPKGTLFVVGEDRPIWRFERGKYHVEATGHGPNYDYALRHGGDVDFAPEDENFVVATYDQGAFAAPTFALSYDNGKSWVEPNTAPSATRADGVSIRMAAGNVAVTGVNKFIWFGTFGGPLRRWDNGTYSTPVFRNESNAVIDMSGAIWHWDYTMRKKAVVSDKTTPGRALIWSPGFKLSAGGALTQDASLLGIFLTTDHGANFARIYNTDFLGGNTAFFSFKLRLNPLNGNHLFVVLGNIDPPVDADPPITTDTSVYFSSNVGPGMTFTNMTGFREVEDVAFTPRPSNRTYPRINVKGWRQLAGVWTTGVWYSDDFNPASPLSATWTLRTNGPEGRLDGDTTLAGDMGAFPGLVIVGKSGGFYFDAYASAGATRPYRVRAS